MAGFEPGTLGIRRINASTMPRWQLENCMKFCHYELLPYVLYAVHSFLPFFSHFSCENAVKFPPRLNLVIWDQ